MRKTIIGISIIILVFIATTVMVSLYILNGDNYLKSFSIISVNNTSTKFNIKFEKVKAANYYDIVIYDSEKNVFFREKVNNNEASFELSNIKSNNEYSLYIFAFDKLGESIVVKNPYTFVYSEPTFSDVNDLLLTNNKDYELLIDGDLSNKDYYISINDGDYVIKKEKLTSNTYTIPHKYFSNLEQILTIKLYDQNTVINSIKLYSNISPVKDIKIINPKNEDTLIHKDIIFTYEGGDNSTSRVLEIYNNDKLLKEISISKNNIIISSAFFKKSEKYTLKVKALYDGINKYTKEDSISFKIDDKDTLKDAYININSSYVKAGSKIVISNPNSSGAIYYTLDGSNPNDNGIEYKEPIEVNNDIKIKTVIKDKNLNDSAVRDFDIHIAEKTEYKVYLSPSNKGYNIVDSSTNLENVSKEMNEIADYIENKLKEKNIVVLRNDPHGNINKWTSEAKSNLVDLYVSLNVNESNQDMYGIETWINMERDSLYSLGNIIQSNLFSIYHRKDGDRGLKYASGSLDELVNVPNGLIINLGYSDYEEDAKWLLENKKSIGETIANSIISYFNLN